MKTTRAALEAAARRAEPAPPDDDDSELDGIVEDNKAKKSLRDWADRRADRRFDERIKPVGEILAKIYNRVEGVSQKQELRDLSDGLKEESPQLGVLLAEKQKEFLEIGRA